MPSSSCSETTTDSAGPASPDASDEANGTSPHLGVGISVEKLDDGVAPHQQLLPAGQQDHSVARGLELAAGAYPFGVVGHGADEGGVVVNDVSMERNSFVSILLFCP